MRPPTIIFGRYRIRYREIPNMNCLHRFFLVDIKRDNGQWDNEFIKIDDFHRTYDMHFRYVFGFLQSEFVIGYNLTGKTYTRLESFMDKVSQYDDYLDDK